MGNLITPRGVKDVEIPILLYQHKNLVYQHS